MAFDKQTVFYDYESLLEFMYLNHDNTDLYLEHCGIQHCPPGHTYGRIQRLEYHLHFIINGRGTLEYKGHIYHLYRGDVFAIPPGATDYKYYADSKDPWHYAWVAFNGTKARQYMMLSGFDNAHIIRPAYVEPENYTKLIYQILEARHITLPNELTRLGYLFEIISLLMETSKSRSVTTPYEYPAEIYVERALHFIESQYQNNINVTDIVEHVGINRSYFSIVFKQQMQISPVKYLQEFRISQARHLLESTGLNLHEIALQVGYKDAFILSKIFKKSTKLSPSQYRNHIL
nr:AraC family transcriptional regulator [uncultured Clostridium sp.]